MCGLIVKNDDEYAVSLGGQGWRRGLRDTPGAVTHYLKYLDDPATFRAAHPNAARARMPDKAKVARGAALGGRGPASREGTGPAGASRAASSDLVQYPFPLRAGAMAYFSLPRDLGRAEAQRIAAFVASLAIDSTDGPGDQERESPDAACLSREWAVADSLLPASPR
jgi:hypothetical protein